VTLLGPEAPPAVRWIARTLEEAGYETWVVGGAVRDVLLGLASVDWDLTTRARPSRVRKLFRRTVPIGIEHGTVGVLARDGTLYEVTTFRRDVETDGRHAVVAFADTLEEDLARRDFTINAIAWHPLRHDTLDPFGGVADLERRVLRTVGRATERFSEDYLRVLRALRFAGRFGLAIDPETWEALRGSVERLPELSAERVREELIKILAADPHPARALDLYRTSGALDVLYPELSGLVGDRAPSSGWTATLGVLDRLPVGRPFLRLAALLRNLEAGSALALLLRLRLSNAQVDETLRRAVAPRLPHVDASDEEFRRWLSGVGASRLAAVARIDLTRARVEEGAGTGADPAAVVASWRKARAVLACRPPLDLADLALDGRDLIRLGYRPGPHFGEILDRLLSWVLEDPARNREEELEERVRRIAGELGVEASRG
jgi:tRNA nucleotidyltransferase (CCA-adding enzyme)